MDSLEKVGVIPRATARNLDLLVHGFTPLVDPGVLGRIEAAIEFEGRAEMERDPSRKQIIPYGIVCRGHRVFVMERLIGGGESRLHGKISVGVGGHINPVDRRSEGLIDTTFRRELSEELEIEGVERIIPYGFINDDSQPVGSVHLGVVFRVDLSPEGEARVRETDALTGRFLAWSDLAELRDRMETWSRFVVDAYEQGCFDA